MKTSTTVKVYRVYIKATPEAIWDAITKPEWTARYGYTGLVDYDLRPGGAYKVRPTEPFRAAQRGETDTRSPDVIIEGEVLEADPPRRLVTTFRMLMDPEWRPSRSPASPTRSRRGDNGICSRPSPTTSKAHPNCPRSSAANWRTRVRAAATPGSSATSRPCSKPATPSLAERPGAPGSPSRAEREAVSYEPPPSGAASADRLEVVVGDVAADLAAEVRALQVGVAEVEADEDARLVDVLDDVVEAVVRARVGVR